MITNTLIRTFGDCIDGGPVQAVEQKEQIGQSDSPWDMLSWAPAPGYYVPKPQHPPLFKSPRSQWVISLVQGDFNDILVK